MQEVLKVASRLGKLFLCRLLHLSFYFIISTHVLYSFSNLHHKNSSMSYHLFRPRLSKTKSEKEVVLFSASAKSEKEAIQSSSTASYASVSAKSSKAQFGRALHERSEDLIDGSLSIELAPRTYPKSGKASSKATVFVIDAKSSKAVPVKVKRSIDPIQVSNDQAEPMKALSFIEYSSQTPVASKEEASGASALVVASVSVGTLLAVSAFALN